MTRTFNPLDPHATPLADGQPYIVERQVFAGVPCLVERPEEAARIRAVCVVYHGAWAAKEGKLGVYSPLTASGVAVVLPDAALHGERQAGTPPGVSGRDYVWLSVARTVAEAPALMDAAQAAYGHGPLFVIGSSMGGYVTQTLARTERRVARAVAVISGGTWDEPGLTNAEARAFLEANRPATHAQDAPPTPLLLLNGDADEVFPMDGVEATRAAYRAAYERAGCPDAFASRTYPGVGHYTSVNIRGDAVTWLQEGLT